jgi:anti-anti-sigma regulatory factor
MNNRASEPDEGGDPACWAHLFETDAENDPVENELGHAMDRDRFISLAFAEDDRRPVVVGDIDYGHAALVRHWLESLGGGRLTVDMSGVVTFDVVALDAFLSAHASNPDLSITRPSGAVMRILEATGTVDVLMENGG